MEKPRRPRARLRAAAGALAALLAATALAACTGGDDVAPGDPTPAAAPAVFLGFDTAGGGVSELSRLGSLVDARPSVVSLFVKLDSTLEASDLQTYTAVGVTPFLTLEPWCVNCNAAEADQPDYRLQRIVDGAFDDDFRRIARVIAAAGHPVYLRFAHEMNGYWYPWAVGENGNDSALYVAAWRHVHALVAAETGSLVRWVWSPNIPIPSRPASAITADDYPGDTQVDYVGLTCYGRDGGTASATCGPGLRALAGITGKPVLLSEIGASGTGQAAWIASLGQLLRADRDIRGVVYFNTTTAGTGATGDYAFDANPSAVEALRGVAAGLTAGG